MKTHMSKFLLFAVVISFFVVAAGCDEENKSDTKKPAMAGTIDWAAGDFDLSGYNTNGVIYISTQINNMTASTDFVKSFDLAWSDKSVPLNYSVAIDDITPGNYYVHFFIYHSTIANDGFCGSYKSNGINVTPVAIDSDSILSDVNISVDTHFIPAD